MLANFFHFSNCESNCKNKIKTPFNDITNSHVSPACIHSTPKILIFTYNLYKCKDTIQNLKHI